jgi:hypothetical protein
MSIFLACVHPPGVPAWSVFVVFCVLVLLAVVVIFCCILCFSLAISCVG